MRLVETRVVLRLGEIPRLHMTTNKTQVKPLKLNIFETRKPWLTEYGTLRQMPVSVLQPNDLLCFLFLVSSARPLATVLVLSSLELELRSIRFAVL